MAHQYPSQEDAATGQIEYLDNDHGGSIAALTLNIPGVQRDPNNMFACILPYGNGVGDPAMCLFGHTAADVLTRVGDDINAWSDERQEFLRSVGTVAILSMPGYSYISADNSRVGGRSYTFGFKTDLGLDASDRLRIAQGDLSSVGSAYAEAIMSNFPDSKRVLFAGKCGGGEIALETAKAMADYESPELEAVNIVEPLNPAWSDRFRILGTAAALIGEFRNIPDVVMGTGNADLIAAHGFDPEKGQTWTNAALSAGRYGLGLIGSGLTNFALARGFPRCDLNDYTGLDVSVVTAADSLLSSGVSMTARTDHQGNYASYEDPVRSALAHLLGNTSYTIAGDQR